MGPLKSHSVDGGLKITFSGRWSQNFIQWGVVSKSHSVGVVSKSHSVGGGLKISFSGGGGLNISFSGGGLKFTFS